MEEKKTRLLKSAILYTLSKSIYDLKDYSSPEKYLEEELLIDDREILNLIKRINSIKSLHEYKIDDASHLIYLAEKMSYDSNQIEDKNKKREEQRLYSVFNRLNGNIKEEYYREKDDDSGQESYFEKSLFGLKNNLPKRLDSKSIQAGSYLTILENYLEYFPSNKDKYELRDIPLYDHIKLTSAYLLGLYEYFISHDKKIWTEEEIYNEKIFLLYTADVSGIQKFIYKITKENALKNLRTRSFYLDMMMEVFIDENLDRLSLNRSNLLYSGGGHMYMIIPNTDRTLQELEEIEKEMKDWLLNFYGIDIYMATAYTPASINSFKNHDGSSYSKLYTNLSQTLDKKKNKRYTSKDIKKLNNKSWENYSRECRVCYSLENLIEDNLCESCFNIIRSSKSIIEEDFFVIMENDYRRDYAFIDMPFARRLYYVSDLTDLENLQADPAYIRSYSKNRAYSASSLTSRILVGDYSHSKYIENLTRNDESIDRVAVLRADVDNLGKTMIAGFPKDYQTLSRTSILSRQLSIFFKNKINDILENPQYFIKEIEDKDRRITIIYSGGDDVFLIGAWEDVISFAIDLKNSLKDFSLSTLTLSAGLGIFYKNYPIYNMALETGKLEEYAKENSYFEVKNGEKIKKEKNSVCLFEKDLVFSWEELEKQVLGEKLEIIWKYKEINPQLGKGFIYKLIEYIRGIDRGEKINISRFVYLISRHEPGERKKDTYKQINLQLYKWIQKQEDRRQLLAALYIFIYSERGELHD